MQSLAKPGGSIGWHSGFDAAGKEVASRFAARGIGADRIAGP
jgi:hypothetical protein